jgi:hypothetical protein
MSLQGVSSIQFNTGGVSSRYLTKQLSLSHKVFIQEFWKIKTRHCRLCLRVSVIHFAVLNVSLEQNHYR